MPEKYLGFTQLVGSQLTPFKQFKYARDMWVATGTGEKCIIKHLGQSVVNPFISDGVAIARVSKELLIEVADTPDTEFSEISEWLYPTLGFIPPSNILNYWIFGFVDQRKKYEQIHRVISRINVNVNDITTTIKKAYLFTAYQSRCPKIDIPKSNQQHAVLYTRADRTNVIKSILSGIFFLENSTLNADILQTDTGGT